MNEYAARKREELDERIRELRAAGWDVVARRERDLALLERDEAREELEDLKRAVGVSASPEGTDAA